MTCSPCTVTASRLPSGAKAADEPSSTRGFRSMPGILSAAWAAKPRASSIAASRRLEVDTYFTMERPLRIRVESVVLLVGQVIHAEARSDEFVDAIRDLGVERRELAVAAIGIRPLV